MQEKTLEEILHGIVALGIGAANIFIKNPSSRQHAGQILDLMNTEVLPLVDDLLAQEAAKTAASVSAPTVNPAVKPGPQLVPSPA